MRCLVIVLLFILNIMFGVFLAAIIDGDKDTEDELMTFKRRTKDMDNTKFIENCKKLVLAYAKAHLDKTDNVSITLDDVYVVWMCKTLQNNKALLSTKLIDGMYYEITYNGDKNEMYFDAYKKWENIAYKLNEFSEVEL